MVEKLEINNKVEDAVKDDKKIFNFTKDGVVVKAATLEEAQEIYKKTIKENKESKNNG